MRIIPVIHYNDDDQTIRNAEIALRLGCYGIFVISMEGNDNAVKKISSKLRDKFPVANIGINLLQSTPTETVMDAISHHANMSWSDYPVIASYMTNSHQAEFIENICVEHNHLFFTACAFKYQSPDPDVYTSALLQAKYSNFIPTTSGSKTGDSVDISKCMKILEACQGNSMAIASGITAENVRTFADLNVSYGLVATGIAEDFYNISERKLITLLDNV